MPKILIRCPKCYWEPDKSCRWQCSDCKMVWDTFTTYGKCPRCSKVYETTSCLRKWGGCGEVSLHTDWYEEVKEEKKSGLFGFWKTKTTLPVMNGDKKWIEDSLLALADILTPEIFKSLTTIVYDNVEAQFIEKESGVDFLLNKIMSIMNIDDFEIQLKVFSNEPLEFSEGIVETKVADLSDRSKNVVSYSIDGDLGKKEIWINEDKTYNLEKFVTAVSYELAVFKLTNHFDIKDADGAFAELTAIAYGFGVAIGNSYFEFAQWTGVSHQGWRMRTFGNLPEQVVAYTMAWLAHYRNEDLAWINHLNGSMKKYFDQCYKYISENKEKVRWA